MFLTFGFSVHDLTFPYDSRCTNYVAFLSCLGCLRDDQISFCIYKYKSTVQSLEYYLQRACLPQ